MRIAQVAPLFESVPPKLYGGTERVVSYLTEELIQMGNEVTLFASGDSQTSAKLIAPVKTALRLDPGCPEPTAAHVVMLEQVFRQASAFDVIHVHIDALHFPLARRCDVPVLTTPHGRLDLAGLPPLFREFSDLPLTSISDSQRRPLAWANWVATVHHGVPSTLYQWQEKPGRYLAFLGRISPEKRVDRAIEIARRVGLPLRIAAKVDRADRDYFADVIQPLLADDSVEFIGEIGEPDKCAFLSEAIALLFPIDWPEPFGLAMIEALACGTPVIAFNCGSVPEVIDDGATGFVVRTIDEAVERVEQVWTLRGRPCRDTFDRRFTAARMAQDYVAVYRMLQERAEVLTRSAQCQSRM
jgi:glycosyltransferase involved in cell wall biosynthesis